MEMYLLYADDVVMILIIITENVPCTALFKSWLTVQEVSTLNFRYDHLLLIAEL